MSKLPLILVGGGGHSRACIDVIEREGKYGIQGIIDLYEKEGNTILGYPILGGDDLLDELSKKEYFFLITVGQIKSPLTRIKLYEKLQGAGAKMATIISPQAYVSTHSTIGEGTIVMHGAIVNAAASVGCNTIINSFSLVEHDSRIGRHTHISTGALINGGCFVGDESFIGSGAILANNIHIGNRIVVGAGSLVIQNIDAPGTYIGRPVKKI